MRRFLILAIVIFALMVIPSAVPQAFADDYSTWVGTPTWNTGGTNSMLGFPEYPLAFSNATATTMTASTTSIAVTPLAGRKQITFRPNASGEIWVSVGTTTAVVQGDNCYPVTYGDEKTFLFDARVPMGHISSTAFSISILQEAREQTNSNNGTR